jgi:S1-C subfamily serine protease
MVPGNQFLPPFFLRMLPPRLKFPAGAILFAASLGSLAPAATAVKPEEPLQPEQLVLWDGSGHYYEAVSVPDGISWYEADRWAWVRGGHLATVNSVDANRFVFSLVKDLKFWLVNKSTGNADGPWLGGWHPKGSPASMDGWRWVDDGTPINFTAWQAGAPHAKANNEFCLYFHVKMEKGDDPIPAPIWNDRNGTAKHHGFVAEYRFRPNLDANGNPVVIQANVEQLAADDAKNDAKAKFAPTQAAAPAQAVAPGQTEAPAQAEVQMLTTQQMSAIVFIEGSKGRATGFLSKVHDVEGVVTNLHVLAVIGDDQKLKVTSLAGGDIPVDGAIGAIGVDILFLRLANPTHQPPVFNIATDVLKTAKIGDPVVVVGNNRGAGVATQISGKIDGIGPTRIEVDAQFQPGNSGSPVFDTTIQQVIGVATYVEAFAVDSLGKPVTATTNADPGVTVEKRWFGYRLDAVPRWEKLDLAKWQRQLKRVEDYRDVCLALSSCAQFQFEAAKAADPRLRPIIDGYEGRTDWVDVAGKKSVTLSSRSVALFRDLFQDIRTYAAQGMTEFKTGDYYDYFHTCVYAGNNVDELVKLRELELKAFDEADTSLADYRDKLKD